MTQIRFSKFEIWKGVKLWEQKKKHPLYPMIVLPLPRPSAKRSLLAVGERSERRTRAEKNPSRSLGFLLATDHVNDAECKEDEAYNPIDYCEA
jgi:hypothetical protein